MDNNKLKIFVLLLMFLLVPFLAYATIYASFNAEEGTPSDTVPNPPFCTRDCDGLATLTPLATYEDTLTAPQGNNYYQFITVNYSSTNTGGSSETVMTDATPGWVQGTVNSLENWKIYNTTDSKSGTITSNNNTTVTCSGGGMNWDNGDSYVIYQSNYYTEVKPFDTAISSPHGNTYYSAFYLRYERIGSQDIWRYDHDSWSKNFELRGAGFRWTIGQGGYWSECPVECVPGDYGGTNADTGKYIIQGLCNPSYSLNTASCAGAWNGRELNQNGYSCTNPFNLDYERWYAFVMKTTVDTFTGGVSNSDGEIGLWVNGVKVQEYTNFKLANTDSSDISYFGLGGTIDQPDYDALPFKCQYDALIVTDSWTDIQSGGYLSDPEGGKISIPGNLTGTIN